MISVSCIPGLLLLASMLVQSPQAVPQIGPQDLPQAPGTEVESTPILSTQIVELDMLPICVIYEPPGWYGAPDDPARQEFTLTNRFGLSTTVTTIRTQTTTVSAGVKLRFLSGSEEVEETSSDSQSTATYRMTIDRAGWATDPHDGHEFPAQGDKMAFFLRPRFKVVTHVANRVQQRGLGTTTIPRVIPMNPPRVLNFTPDFEVPWTRCVATVAELIQGTGNGQAIPPDVRDRLLALDPFTGTRFLIGPAGSTSLPEFEKKPPGWDPFYPSELRTKTERFIRLNTNHNWSPTGNAQWLGMNVEVGTVNAETHTETTRARIMLALTPTFSSPVGDVTFSLSASDEVTFSYSTNEMTSESTTTDAQVYFGGGDGSDEGLYRSDVYYDSTFGTLAMTRTPAGAPNVAGLVSRPDGGPADYHWIEFFDPRTGEGTRVRSNANGAYQAHLAPGRYVVMAVDDHGRFSSSCALVDIAHAEEHMVSAAEIRLGAVETLGPLCTVLEILAAQLDDLAGRVGTPGERASEIDAALQQQAATLRGLAGRVPDPSNNSSKRVRD